MTKRGVFEAKPAGDRTGRSPAPLDATFWAVFEHAPDAYLLLAADPPRFTMVAANDARLRVTMTRREDVIDRPLFEVFPDNPDDPGASGVRNLQASLHEVLRTRKAHRMALQKYDIRRPDGRFEERYWDPLNSPVFDEQGNLVYIIHRVEDVTEQVRAGSRLRILESVVTTANDAVVVTEAGPLEAPGPRILYVNEAFTRMTGYGAREVIGKTPRILQGPDTDPEALRRIHAGLERQEPVRLELLNYRKDGSPFWVELSIAPVLDESGRVVQWTSVQRETTERRRAEETALRLARETAARALEATARNEIASILESITDAFYAVDREWRFIYVNQRAEEILRRPRQELLGRSLWEEFPQAVRTIFDREYRQAMEKQTTTAFEAFYEPLGTWVEVHAYPSPERLSVYLRDITRRKLAEQRLRESEERYRLLADLIPQHIWTTDPNGYHRYFSRRWYDFTGVTLEETEGDRWLRFIHPDDRERTIARWQQSLRTGEPYSIEYRFRGADGEYRWFLGQALPQRDDAGTITGWFGTLTDISDRKRLDEERDRLLAREREAREQVTTILESITDAFFAVDPEWRFTYVNREAERLLRRRREELIGRALWEEFSPALGTSIEREYRRAMAEQATVHFETHAPTTGLWVDVRAYPSRDGLSVFFRDVTARKQAEERLRESETRFRALAENAAMAIFVIDEESRIEFANPVVERIFGYTVAEIVGRPLDILMPEGQRRDHHAGIRRYLDTGRRNIPWEGVELPGLTKDGRVVPLEISMGAFVREGRHYFTGIARDITERKQAEAALRESEERFRTLGNSIPQLAWMADSSGWIFWYNDRWHEYTGTTLEEMEGWGWQKVHHPGHVDRVVARIRRAFDTGEPWEDTFPLRSRTGEYRWFLSRALPIRDAGGKVVRWFGTNTDITEQLDAAAERERLLEREREARAEAERRRAEVEKVTESRAGLIRGFSHDVRNPLTVADMSAQLLEVADLPGEERENVRGIRRSIRTSLRLIDDLLDIARAEAGQLEIECVSTDVGQVAREVAEDFRAPATAAGLSLDVRVPEDLRADTDPTRLRQILGNLLSNAVKYAPASQVTMSAELRDSGGPRPGEWVAVAVRDTGPGIPKDKKEAVFQEYTRLDPTAQQGAGIGLAISRRIARLLGGDLTVESEPGQGATFTVWLPPAAS